MTVTDAITILAILFFIGGSVSLYQSILFRRLRKNLGEIKKDIESTRKMNEGLMRRICETPDREALWTSPDDSDTCYVFVGSILIREFDTEDAEYNRICAEELCELLNQEKHINEPLTCTAI